MNARVISEFAGRVSGHKEPDPHGRNMRRWSASLMICGSAGMLAGLTGLVINALLLIGIADNKGLLPLVGVWLLVASFSLLSMASHCLDKFDASRKAIRSEYWENRGLGDRDR